MTVATSGEPDSNAAVHYNGDGVVLSAGLVSSARRCTATVDIATASDSKATEYDNGDGFSTKLVSSTCRCAATSVAASGEPDSNAAIYYNGD